jgi:hypothetical protein
MVTPEAEVRMGIERRLVGYASRVVLAVLIAGSAGAASAEGVGSLAAMLSCEGPPQPTQILLRFKQARLLGPPTESADHNRKCWPLEPGLKYRGARFVSVCAAVDRPDEAKRHPELYRGLMLAPYAGLWLEARVTVSTLYRWAIMTLPSRGHFEIHATEDGAMVACTGSWFPPSSAEARA